MSRQEKISQKDDICQQIQKLRDEANTANAKITKFIENRNELNEQVKKAREEIAVLKTERDSINEKVRLLKQQRDAIRAQSEPVIKQINAVKDKIFLLQKKLPRESQQDLQEELDAIEWKIQTTSLDLDEEKGLIAIVKQLEIQLKGYKKIDVQRNKIKDLMAQRGIFEAQADVFHKELTDLANKSQALHSTMIEKVNAAKISRAQADAQHQAYVKTKDDIVFMSVKIAELTGQLQGLTASIYEEDKVVQIETQKANKEKELAAKEKQQEMKGKQQAIKEKLEAEAKIKLQKGEQLSWNEFQLVMGDDAEDDPETQA